ncbi:MAG: glycosyltransferase family 4 protein [Vicinamibacterales bacterium]
MRVLYVTDSPTVSGAEHVWFGYLPALGAPGNAAHAFISAANPRLIRALDERGTPYTTTRSFSTRMIEVTVQPAAIAAYVRAFAGVRRELCELIARERPDVLHSISFPACLYAALASRATGVPQIWHEHNIKRIHAVNTRLYRFVAATCAWIVGPSKAVTDNIARAGVDPAKLVPLYNGIDLSSFTADDARAAAVRAEFGWGPQTPVVGLFGQLLPHKGHATLIDAVPTILRHVPDARFVFVGALENPPYEAALRERIAAAGLADRFTFTGWRTDVPHVMRAVDVLVVPTTSQEPAALSLMEGMAMGRPLVASRTGGTPELIVDGETGLIFPPGDAAALADATAALLGDPARRRQMGEAGRARMERHFTVERHVDGMFDLYRRAVAARS